MAEQANEEEVEYESDPEETTLSLKLRRREASDDEEEGGEGREEKAKPARRLVDSDGESDGQGGAAEYDDEDAEDDEYVEEEEEDEELIEDDEEYVEEGEGEYEERGGEVAPVVNAEGGKVRAEGSCSLEEGRQVLNKNKVDDKSLIDDSHREDEEEEEKKENEPYAVPTAGAFYMHDDRFRDNAGGRGRRTFGGRRLWESKDEKKWGHDKFEELTMQERHYEGGRRTSRGRYRGRGRIRGPERGYAQGNNSRGYNMTNNSNKSASHNNAPRSVRGRGPRRYQQSSFKNNGEASSNQNQQPGKPAEKSSRSVAARMSTSQSNVEAESVPVKKNTFASSLNSASPPFYPSGSSSKDVTLTQKSDGHPATTTQNICPPVADQNFMHPGPIQRGKAVVDSMAMDKLCIDDSLSAVGGKPSIPLHLPVTGSSALSSNQTLQLRGQGRGISSLPQVTYQPTGSAGQVNRIPPPAPLHTIQRNQVISRGQSSSQQSAQSSRGGSQVSSPPKASHSRSSFEPAEMESPSESMNSKTSLISKGKGNVQSSTRGSFLYGGAQVMGASGNLAGGHGDKNFPAFLPVMQFGAQHPGGIGVPAVGMAFPGYVGQPQLGIGNSEMTWLPVLTGAAGALGATYGSPYITVDGAYHSRPSGQTSSLAPAIKENSANNPNDDLKPSQRLELANNDFGLRQKNPRRYTEMKFDH